jgi:cobalt-zinc-cadmium efflux system protein
MGHDHDHDHQDDHAHGSHPEPGAHGHGHGHAAGAPTSHRFAFAVGIALNLSFVIVETVYGVLSHSMALVADAGHNLSDVLGLTLAWGAAALAARRPTKLRTYGFRGATIMASLINALVLLFVTGGIVWESLRRLALPEPVGGKTVIVVALMGVATNGFSALLFARGRKEDLNVRSAFLHLASDAALALGVAVSGFVMLRTGWAILDPLVSVGLSLFILAGTWSLLKQSLNLALHAVPEGIDPDAVQAFLASLPGVAQVHDLHVWAMSTTENALTAHLVMSPGADHPRLVGTACKEIRNRFRIEHSTLQLESTDATGPCHQAADGSI